MTDTSRIYPTCTWINDSLAKAFTENCDKIQTTMQACCLDKINRYAKVSNLDIHWSNDNIEMKSLTSELLNDVLGIYNFSTDVYEISIMTLDGAFYSLNQVKHILRISSLGC